MLLTLLGTAFSSILAGGATGLLGVVLQRFFDFLNAKNNLAADKQKMDHELAMRDKDALIMDKEWAGRLKVSQTEGATASDVAASNAFAASLLREPERYATGEAPKNFIGYVGWFLLACADVIRGVVRPGLTIYLCWITTKIYWEAKAILDAHGAALTAQQALDLTQTIVATILYLTTTCVLWWFGTRNKQTPPTLKQR